MVGKESSEYGADRSEGGEGEVNTWQRDQTVGKEK